MVKTISLFERGQNQRPASLEQVMARHKYKELRELLAKYVEVQPFYKFIYSKFCEQFTMMEYALETGNLKLFWEVYNRLGWTLLCQYGVEIPVTKLSRQYRNKQYQ
jgi:hypothetical protein